MHAAILAFFIPAEFTVSNIFRRQELEGAQQYVPLRHLVFLADDADLYQALIRFI